MKNQYETVFIVTPVLSDAQMKETVKKYMDLITDNGGEIVSQEDWGLKKLAYPIANKTTGYYNLVEYKADPSFVQTLEIQFGRDEERVIRHLTVAMDKDAVAYAEHRRAKRAEQKSAPKAEETRAAEPEVKEAPAAEEAVMDETAENKEA